MYLVTNQNGSEGVVFTDKKDAEYASGRRGFYQLCSNLADQFNESYYDGENVLPMKKVKIEETT